ncbi:MAG: hypothetical protein ACP5P4_06375 [Steroidobacteraceae bacterium]
MSNEEQGGLSIGAAGSLGFGSTTSGDTGVIASRAQNIGARAATTQSTVSSPDAIHQSLAQINERLAATDHVLVLRVDAVTGHTIAEIQNAVTGQVLQRVPSQDQQHLADLLAAWAHGHSILADVVA